MQPKRWRRADLVAYVERDWQRIQDKKREHWAAMHDESRGAATVPLVHELGDYVRQITPLAVRSAQRSADLQHHIELKRKIDATAPAFVGRYAR